MIPARPPNFDRIAPLYRWCEYLALGTLLTRTRAFHLDRGALNGTRQALILGDGDGRFTERLLARNRTLQATAVDLSAAMLRLLRRRCAWSQARLTTHHADARSFRPAAAPDLVVTHFFLDCLPQPEIASLVANLQPHLSPDCLWLVSEFRIPGGPLHWPARLLVRSLYLGFRMLTGLRVTRLPDHAAALAACGFSRIAQRHLMAGILTTELWKQEPPLSH